jgi:hypothetical protein
VICCAAVLHPSHCLFLQVVSTRNSLPVLQACIKLAVHLTNAGIKRPWLATFNRRYPGYHHGTPHGPLLHC